MDKVAMYKEEIEKRAMRKMNELFRGLSEAARARIMDAGLVNHKKDMEGLAKGTVNIVKKYKGKITHMDSGELAHEALIDSKSGVVKKMMDASGLDLEGNAEHRKMIRDHFRGIATAGGNHLSLVKSGLVNQGNMRLPGSILPTVGKLPERKTLGDRYTRQLLLRHEADELRYGRQSMSNPKLGYEYKGDRAPATNVPAGHMSHKVMGRESANIAMAPDDVNTYMHSMRNTTGEAPAYAQHGHVYGKSAKYDRNTMHTLDKLTAKGNKETTKSLLAD